MLGPVSSLKPSVSRPEGNLEGSGDLEGSGVAWRDLEVPGGDLERIWRGFGEDLERTRSEADKSSVAGHLDTTGGIDKDPNGLILGRVSSQKPSVSRPEGTGLQGLVPRI